MISDREARAVVAETELRRLFALTRAEAQVASALAGGQTVVEIAAARRLALPTVRSQVQAVLAKTGTRRQADLTRLISAFAALRPSRTGSNGKSG